MEEPKLRHRKVFKVNKFTPAEEEHSSNKNFGNVLLPTYLGYGILLIVLFLLRFFYIYENMLPTQLKIRDAGLHPGKFIGERAELQLKRLTGIGTRVVGSYENEVLTVDFLKRELSFISQAANKIHKIELEVQKPTGSYYLYMKPYGFRNYYANIQNIIVKLSSTNATNSVLLNCHYDTVPESPGASDNGLNCAVMMEILQVLSSNDVPLKNNIIFLFNGAEENPLQASHGFLSHKWNKEVKVVINLDSAGSGGKELLFQTTGESWLIDTYAKSVPRPSGAVQAEELFQFGIIPSDTDFRVFRDFGNYSGMHKGVKETRTLGIIRCLDLAHCFNGYIYHTKYDKTEFIRPGVYQFTGENMLALTTALVQSSELGKSHGKSKIVYFDVFQLFFVSYSQTTSYILNITTVILSVWSIIKTLKSFPGLGHSSYKILVHSSGGWVLALLVGAAVVFVIAKTLDLSESTMSWYLRSWLVIPLYGFPTILSITAILLLMQTFMKKDCPGHRVVYFITGAKVFWSTCLFICTVLGIRSSYLFMLFLLPMSVGSLLLFILKSKTSVKYFLLTQVVSLPFPLLYTQYQAVRVLTVMIPMTARMGPHINSEMVIGALTFILTVVSLSYVVPLLLLLRKLKTFLIVLCAAHMLAMFGVISTKYGFPYDGNSQDPALQRFYVYHCERTFHDVKGVVRKSDSGIFVQNLDRNNLKYISKVIPEVENRISMFEECENELFCGYPVFTSRFIRPAAYSAWIPALPPTIHHPTSLEVINQTQILVSVRRTRLLITGPDHITIGLSPRKNVSLIKWSLDEVEPEECHKWNDRPVYMVYYSHGLMGGTLEFDIDLEISKQQSGPVLDIVVIGHYMHDKQIRTQQFKEFLNRFPSWAHVTSWTTTYKSWVI